MGNSGLHIVGKKLASGERRWYVFAYRGGPQILTQDGERPAITDALKNLAEAARMDERRPTDGTIAALILYYKLDDAFLSKAPVTRRDYNRQLDRIIDRFGDAPLAAFEDRRMRGEIIAWRDNWRAQTRTADAQTKMLSTVLKWALDRGMLSINVAAGIPALHKSNRSEIIWTDETWRALEMARVGKGKTERPAASPQLMQALRLAALTGLRLGDLIALDWRCVGAKSIITTTSKSRHRHRVVIPIFPELKKLLADLAAGRDKTGTILRNSRGNPWTQSGLESVYRKARLAAGRSEHIHDLRGTYVTWLAAKRLTNQEIARIVGWSEQSVEQLRRAYVDEAQVVASLIDRLSA